jgi:TolB protein
MGRTVANLSVVLFAVMMAVMSVGRVLPRGEQLLFSSSRNWQAVTWDIYLMDMERRISQRLFESRTDGTPGLPIVWSPDGTQIAYLSGTERLKTYLINAEGKNPQRLTDGLTDHEYNAEWSPDGRYLAFIGEYRDVRDVYIAQADGTQPRCMTNGAPPFDSLMWSPDSRFLALESISPNQDIFILNVETGELRNLTDAPGSDLRPAWSPDGTQIGFMSSRYSTLFGNTRFDLYLVNADGSNLRRLTNQFPADSAWTVNWSPDGRRIAFGSISWAGGADIYVVDVPYNLVRNVTRDTARDANPVWSPDGSRLAFESRQGGRWSVHLISADGWERAQITDSASESRRPMWSPDGERLFYISNPAHNWDLYTFWLGSAEVERLTRTRSIDFSPVWRP